MTYINAFITITNIFIVFFIVGRTAIADVLMWMPRIGSSELLQTPPITQPRPFHLLYTRNEYAATDQHPTENCQSTLYLLLLFFCILFDFRKAKGQSDMNALLAVSVFNFDLLLSVFCHIRTLFCFVFFYSLFLHMLSLVQQLCLLNTWSQIDKVCNCIK